MTISSEPLIKITRKQAHCFAFFLVLYEFLTYIANDMIMPGMLQVVNTFHASESTVATSLTAYVLGGASLQIFLGPLSDWYGRRPVMLFGAAFFFTCTLLISVSNSMTQFLLCRYFQGMGLCFIGVIGYATLQEIFSEMAAVRLIALLTNVAMLAPLLGPMAGASFILYFSWRSIFFIIAALAFITFWGIWKFMPEPVGAMKNDGGQIPKVPLKPDIIYQNYKLLVSNQLYMLGTVAAGFLSIPCIAWIALSPVIIISDAKLSVIDYALWQLPLFGAGIIGNFFLRRLSYTYSILQILKLSLPIIVIGLALIYILPLYFSKNFLWMIPGLSIYGFGLTITNGPLSRFILFSTQVAKGTASALFSLVGMAIQAIGVELCNKVYTHHNNLAFAAFCAIAGLIYLLILARILYLNKQNA